MKSIARTIGTLFFLAVATAAQSAPVETSTKFLASLSAARNAARSMPLGTYPPVVRDVESIVGMSQASIFQAMGAPDSCPWTSFEQCKRVPSWIYSFWPTQKDTAKGAGWSLILDVNDQRVWRAYWIAQ